MKPHPLDPVSLVFGGLFATLGIYLVASDARWEAASPVWVLPAVLVIIGGTILWSTVRRLGADITPRGEEEAVSDPGLDTEVGFPLPTDSD